MMNNKKDEEEAAILCREAFSILAQNLHPNAISHALEKLREARRLCPSERKYVEPLKDLEQLNLSIKSSSLKGPDDVGVKATPPSARKTFFDLYAFQKVGVNWLVSLFESNAGGLLADDMGLGKTVQTTVFLEMLFEGKHIKTVLIICPLTLLSNWETEFGVWSEHASVSRFHRQLHEDRMGILSAVQRKGGVLLTTYALARIHFEKFSVIEGGPSSKPFTWDYVILDEAQNIKNWNKTNANLALIPTKLRLGLTGTPLQNNLKELWALFNFIAPRILASYPLFKAQFEAPIVKGREKDATPRDKAFGNLMADELRTVLEPHMLRRTKGQVFGKASDLKMAPKVDWVLWVQMSKTQVKIYKEFLELQGTQAYLNGDHAQSPLTRLVILKKLCDHPMLLSRNICNELLANKRWKSPKNHQGPERSPFIDEVSDNVLLKESGKLEVLMDLLEHLKATGHRTLVFSRSLMVLDIIERILKNRDWTWLRLDGGVKSPAERDAIVSQFQADDSYKLCLLTSQVGGVGLTLTGADRVVIYDPSWNPGVDSQAVDRAHRIGQNKRVVVYRLITCGTLEEKIYRRQVFKGALIKQNVDHEKDPFRHFTRQELKQLFVLDNPRVSQTCDQLIAKAKERHETDEAPDGHQALVQGMAKIYGISDHNLLFVTEK